MGDDGFLAKGDGVTMIGTPILRLRGLPPDGPATAADDEEGEDGEAGAEFDLMKASGIEGLCL